MADIQVETQKLEYLESEKSFLDEIKNIFDSFWSAIIWWKIKISKKIADTSFKQITTEPQAQSLSTCVSLESLPNTL